MSEAVSSSPRATARRPISQTAIRDSSITRMMFVFDRSLPGTKMAALAMAARKVASVSASPASAVSTSTCTAFRSASRAAFWRFGEAESSASRIRSIAANAMSGFVSHVSERMSHSFGPRDPYSARNSSSAATKALAFASLDPRSRASRPCGPLSKISMSVAEARTCRLRSHIAYEGAAESTPPKPLINRIAASGLPIAAQIAPMVPGPIDAAPL